MQIPVIALMSDPGIVAMHVRRLGVTGLVAIDARIRCARHRPIRLWRRTRPMLRNISVADALLAAARLRLGTRLCLPILRDDRKSTYENEAQERYQSGHA
jgi:hypothetical protein